jgi:hypothetical protein
MEEEKGFITNSYRDATIIQTLKKVIFSKKENIKTKSLFIH